MKTAWFLFILLYSSVLVMAQSPVFQYVSPKPNSILVSCETNIILRSGSYIDRSSLGSGIVHAEGMKSGIHEGKFILSDDGRTIVFNPTAAFSGNEKVTVTIQQGIKTVDGTLLDGFSFSFTTMPQSAQPLRKMTADASLLEYNATAAALPAPPITIDSVNNPATGCIFLATWDRNVPKPNYANFIFVLDSSGHILDSLRINGPASDFKILSNGLLSYARGNFSGIVPTGAGWTSYVLDNSFTVLDSFQIKNGYALTDSHEFQILPNGHALMMSYVAVTYDMSTIVPDGKTDAAFTICVLQEQDLEKNVVFEWRDIDHIPITDSDLPLNTAQINYTTLNAYTMDDDGNFLVSSRNLSTILKVNRSTGEIIWRMGGRKNEFTFVGEHAENAPFYFARQHNISRLQNGHISLYDNGEYHTPQYSRSVEYELDEVHKVATMVSEYRYPTGNIFSLNGGMAEKLSNGGWFMGFGNLAPQSPVKRIVVEAHADGSTALELSVPNNVTTYRISKQPWKNQVKTLSITIPEVYQGNSYSFNKQGITTGVTIKYIQLSGDLYNMATITRIPYGPIRPEFIDNAPRIYPVSIRYDGASIYSQNAEMHIDLAAYPEIKHPENTSFYVREFADQGLLVSLPTTYNKTANELIASTPEFGEIVFGEPDVQQSKTAPILIQPLNKCKTLANSSVLMRWESHGLVTSFQLQISTDSAFGNVSLDTTIENSFISKAVATKNQKNYWRVRTNGNTVFGDWSSVWSFVPTDPYIKILGPNGGEKYPIGDTIIVRWETNISDSVRVSLLHGSGSATVLGKTNAGNNAFQWMISANLTLDSTYKLIINTYRDSTLADTSDIAFSLTTPTSVETMNNEIPSDFVLYQNYPNPFNPSTTIRYAVPARSRVRLRIYNVLGQVITDLVNTEQSAGWNQTVWNANVSSGLYFYRLEATSLDNPSKRFFDTKKMLLLR